MSKSCKDIPQKDYQGNCHCGAIKFNVKLPELKETSCCDCSICSKKGIMWNRAFKKDFSFERGEELLKSYEFGKGNLIHKFCPTCGVQVFGLFTDAAKERIISINVRTLTGINPWSLKVNMENLSQLEPKYNPPPFTGALPTPEPSSPDQKTYTGSCHCGLIRLALTTPPLPTCTIKEDNCSICIRHAYTFIYPSISSVSIINEEQSTSYIFGRKFMAFHFCPVCGVSTHSRVLGPPKEVREKWSEEVRRRNEKNFDLLPVNVRVLEGVEWSELKVERDDKAFSEGSEYKVD